MRPRVAASSSRAAVAAIPVLLAACIPGVLTMSDSDGGASIRDSSPPGADGAGGDSSNPSGDVGADHGSMDASSEQGDDSAPGVDAPVDSSDAAPLPDGYIQCPATSVQCQAAGVGECCDTIYGSVAADGSFVYSLTMASCEALGGANCGSLSQVGNSFTENFPQSCATVSDCTTGSVCCAAITMGAIALGKGINCESTCPSPDRIICRNSADCAPPLSCQPETDAILSHVYARYCQ